MRARLGLLVFASGLAGLIDQVVWQRQLRLVFGAGAAATAAVVAIFVAGLGVGGVVIGARADRSPHPLRLYAALEAVVAISAALSPLLLAAARAAYLALGGEQALGAGGGAAARVALSALVLAVPTIAMGGALPAAVRSAARDRRGRAPVARLYALNTLGAVAGCMLATFWLVEAAGARGALWTAAAVNALVATLAWLWGGAATRAPAGDVMGAELANADAPDGGRAPANATAAAPAALVLAIAALAGFAYFAMEVVWYRMLAPILGGSVFTFGVVLAAALLGIGGGAALHAWKAPPATLRTLGLSCLCEAALLLLPYALGDRVAALALWARPEAGAPLASFALSWGLVAAVVVIPASVVAGLQYPLLVELLRGRSGVGARVGLVAAWNTAGSAAGALAVGFGLLAGVGAIACWLFAAGSVALAGVACLGLARDLARAARAAPAWAFTACAALGVVVASALARGPTAAWRHGQIGVGRASPLDVASPNFLRAWEHEQRRALVWEAEGAEASVAVVQDQGLAFVVNGRVDGNAVGDAATQVMGGLIGALLHPAPRRALVIGLGTGSTAGWLAAAPGLERVDVIELEPEIVRVARECAPVNRAALDDPRVHLVVGDAREVVQTAPIGARWDVVFSEPSNPYRVGVASLFTAEYYRTIAAALGEEGVFAQWVQAYEIDPTTLKSIYATLLATFPRVETWRLAPGDLLLVASRGAVVEDPAELRRRLGAEPLASALRLAWGVTDVEGALAHRESGPAASRALGAGAPVNTDDDNRVEFGFARSVGAAGSVDSLLAAARAAEAAPSGGGVDWAAVEEERVAQAALAGREAPRPAAWSEEAEARVRAHGEYFFGNLAGALRAWQAQDRAPRSWTETALLGEALAQRGDDGARAHIERLRALSPADADAVLGRLLLRSEDLPGAARALAAAFAAHRVDPWPDDARLGRALSLAVELAGYDAALGASLFGALDAPFALHALEAQRRAARLEILARAGLGARCLEVFLPIEPDPIWLPDALQARRDCYQAHRPELAAAAAADLRWAEACGAWLSSPRCW